MVKRLAAPVAAAVVLALAACSEPLEFAAWTVPVPDGTPVIDYAPVALENRTDRIGVNETLRVGAGEDPQRGLYLPTDLAVADDGRLYVLDVGNHWIQVFDANGRYAATIGREGDGPGELRSGGMIAVADSVLVRVGDGRITSWALDGGLIDDTGISGSTRPRQIESLPGGSVPGGSVPGGSVPDGSVPGGSVPGRSVLATFDLRAADDPLTTITSFSRLGTDGEKGDDYARVTGPTRTITLVEGGLTIIGLPTPAPWSAISRHGDVYLTNADEYQVLALDAVGATRWALRTAWPRLPMSDEDMERAVLRRTTQTPATDLAVAWPTHNPALANGGDGAASLHVDGHGHLYVFPFIRDPEATAWPVDVYGADGERLFTGMIDIPGWWDATDDFVYRLEVDPATEERLVVRYRLEEPFS